MSPHRRIARENRGQTFTEYAILALVFLAALIGVLSYLSDAVRDYMMRIFCVFHLPFP